MRQGIQRLFSARGIKTINEFKFSHYKKGGIPLFRVLDKDGIIQNKQLENSIPTGYPLEALKKMIELNIYERVMTEAQKRGRIDFFITSTGEEATTIGCAAALNQDDWIFTQYREAGAYLWRGSSTEQMTNQIMGNIEDPTKGRQMPMHFGDSTLRIFMNSSLIATQMPQAVGCAFSFKFQNLNAIVAAFLGDGASSEGDSQVSYNMAQTLKCPVLFLCRNNQYALSTPSSKQFDLDGPADNAMGHGMTVARVDGCDFYAVYIAVKNARNYCIENKLPVFLEFSLYRHGDHSSSDDSASYRDQKNVEKMRKLYNPIERLTTHLIKAGIWSKEEDLEFRSKTEEKIESQLTHCEQLKRPPISEIMTDLFDEMSPRLKKQQEQILTHVEKYKQIYDQIKYIKK